MKVLSYNTMLLAATLSPGWGQEDRAIAIAGAKFMQDNDAIVLSGLFDASSSDKLMNELRSRGYKYQTPVIGRSTDGWDSTSGQYRTHASENGGVAIVSKHQINRRQQHIYPEGCASDKSSNKGFAYVSIKIDGSPLHIIGTHTQSNDHAAPTGEPAKIRRKQFKEIDQFLKDKAISPSEMVVVGGDLNVDSRTAEGAWTSEYKDMLTQLNVAPADDRTGAQYSFDTTANSIAKQRYAGSPSEDLDYVLLAKGHARPPIWRNEVIEERTAPWSVSRGGKQHAYTDLSDHYPIMASDA